METVLEVVRNSLSTDTDEVPTEPLTHATPPSQAIQGERLFLEDVDLNWDYHEEQVFDDTGQGAGIEGDLEAEDG